MIGSKGDSPYTSPTEAPKPAAPQSSPPPPEPAAEEEDDLPF